MSQPSSVTDFSQYLPPGIYTNPISGPLLAINNAVPTTVGLFGLTVGKRNFIQSFTVQPDINDSTPGVNQTLAKAGILPTSIVVTSVQSYTTQDGNPITISGGKIYTLDTDYTIVLISGVWGHSDALYAISRVIGGHIAVGQVLQVSYSYTDANFFQPQRFYSYQDVVTAYGPPFNLTTGAIQSELTLAAKFAFLNGAYQVMCVAVDPANPDAPTSGDYYYALQKFNDLAPIAIICPATGSYPSLYQFVQEHVDSQSSHRFERRAILGIDGSASPVSTTQRVTYAQELVDERIAMVSPATFTYYAPEINQTITLGGQYIAAALSGMVVNMSPAQPLTHKIITGFSKVAELDLDANKSQESASGLMVVEMAPPNGQRLWVRHGLTTDPSDLLHREWSITGQQDAMVYTLRAYLNAANLIGQPIYDYTLINVKAAVQAGLQSLVTNSVIVNYHSLSVRQLLSNPDVLEVSFSWLPAFPLNYVVLTFGISLTTGSVATQGASPNINDFTGHTPNISIGNNPTSSINDFGGPGNTLAQG